MTPMKEFANARAADPASRRPVLSVLIPFYGSAPHGLVASLAACAAPPHLAGGEDAIEIVCADDGSPDRTLAPALERRMAGLAVACRLLESAANLGRSRIRNRLAEAARGEYVLFLDGDMQLRDPAFLRTYLDFLAGRETAGIPVDVAFGGFEMPVAETAGGGTADDAGSSSYALHVYDSRRSHCLSAAERAKSPAKYTYTSNLLVRRDLMLACPFAEDFTGWGWEDVDWSLRIAECAHIDHIDNPAVHAGFSTAEALLAKYRESVANFRRLCLRHPEAVREFPIFKASLMMARIPFAAALQTLLEAAMLGPWPVRARYAAMKLLRACLYRDVVRSLPMV